MSDFYIEMAGMTRELLAPTAAGGLGQGKIELVRVKPGTPNPAASWEPVELVRTVTLLRGAVSGVSEQLVGQDFGAGPVVAGDRVVTTEPPTVDYGVGDRLRVDGVEVNVIGVRKIPAAGVTSAVQFIIRG